MLAAQMSPQRRTVTSAQAPPAIGPYSHAVAAGRLLFCSGQIALDPQGEQIVGETGPEQVAVALDNLSAVCDAAGASLADAARVTLYVVPLEEFAAINEAYGRYFEGSEPPARVTVGVSALPRGALVEVEAVVPLPED